MSTTQAARDPWLDQVRLSPTQWFELVTGRKSVPFATTPGMPTFHVLSRKDLPVPKGFDASDPVCPDCSQYPLVQHGALGEHQVFWCNGCGVLVDVSYTGTQVDRVQILRPTNPGHRPTDML